MSIVYKLVTPELIQEAIELYQEFYLRHDPVLKAVGCTQVFDSDKKTVIGFLEQGWSWCALDEATGRMVGVGIGQLVSMADLPQSDVKRTFDDYVRSGLSKELASVWLLYDHVFDYKEILTTYKVDKMIEITAICVHPDYKKRGIAGELSGRYFDTAKQHGVTVMANLCTSAYAQLICERFGFVKFKEVSYSTYVDSETKTRLFKDVEEPHKAIISYVKKVTYSSE